MRNALVRIDTVVTPPVVQRPSHPARRATTRVWNRGLSHPQMVAFRERLDQTLRDVATIELRTRPDVIRSELMEAALDGNNPRLVECTDDSLAQFVLHAARTRLKIGSELQPVVGADASGNVVLVPVEGVKGIIRLLRETGGARDIGSGTVYEADTFTSSVDESGARRFVHEPNFSVRDRGRVTCYFAIAQLPKYEWASKVLTPAELEALRLASPWPDHPCWLHYPHRMGEVHALRALGALIPEGPATPRSPEPPAARPHAMPGLPADPYASADSANLGETTYTVVDEPMPINIAHAARLPEGVPTHGRKSLRETPSSVLRRFVQWAEKQPARMQLHARLLLAIHVVLNWRQERAAQDSPSAGAVA